MISTKFREVEGGWSTYDIRGGYDIGVWKEIRKNWNSFFQSAAFSLGDGRGLSFWKDPWCGEEAFSRSFPSLFSLAAHKDTRVAEM